MPPWPLFFSVASINSRGDISKPGCTAPTRRLMQKLGLLGFRNVGPLRDDTLVARKVGIRLKQHVGAPCEPVVKVAQRVAVGQLLGQPPTKDGKAALGAPVHASIDGTVTRIAEGVIWIEQ